jgi:hypothetical protein
MMVMRRLLFFARSITNFLMLSDILYLSEKGINENLIQMFTLAAHRNFTIDIMERIMIQNSDSVLSNCDLDTQKTRDEFKKNVGPVDKRNIVSSSSFLFKALIWCVITYFVAIEFAVNHFWVVVLSVFLFSIPIALRFLQHHHSPNPPVVFFRAGRPAFQVDFQPPFEGFSLCVLGIGNVIFHADSVSHL